MGLADAGRTEEEQALVDDRESLGEGGGGAQCLHQRVGAAVLEVVQRTVAIAGRDARIDQRPIDQRLAPALAARRARSRRPRSTSSRYRDRWDTSRSVAPAGQRSSKECELRILSKRADGVQLFVRLGRSPFSWVASVDAVVAGGVDRTRSVGDDFTRAVLRRCSQSSMPRASSRLIYSMNSLTSACIPSILRRMLRMISTRARLTPRSRARQRENRLELLEVLFGV